MDKDNFEYTIEGFHVVMSNGELEINDCMYEDDPDYPMYVFAREIAKAKGLIEQ